MFHTHFFQSIETNKNSLYCRCGEIRCVHFWEHLSDIIRTDTRDKIIVGRTRKCKHCGELTVKYLLD